MTTYTWRPVGLPERTVWLVPVHSWAGECFEVRALDGTVLGSVLRAAIRKFGWHWRYPNSHENHGSHLRTREDACSGLLFAIQK